MTDKKDPDKRFIRFDWRKDKKLFCRLFFRCFVTQAVGYAVLAIWGVIQLVNTRAQIFSEAELAVYDMPGVYQMLAERYSSVMFTVLIPATAAFFLVNNFLYEINKFGDDPEWKERYIAEKIKTEKTNNILVIIAALCLINYISFAGI